MTPVVVALALIQAPAPQAPLPPATVALVETYADGRVMCELTSAKPVWMWTPVFPRLKDWQPPAGSLPVTALRIDRVLVGPDIRADISLLAGRSHEQQTAVATVLVRPGMHVVVDELRNFGVEPIDLSLADVTPSTPYPPSVSSITPDLGIAAVTLLNAPYPGYRITLRNLSHKAVANFHVQSYRGAQKALSSIERGREGRPAMTPQGSYTFDINLTGGGVTCGPLPVDIIQIDAVLWDDGTADGTLPAGSVAIASDAGRRLQLTRINQILKNALKDIGVGTLARIRTDIDALADPDVEQLPAARQSMRRAKAGALDDLTLFERGQPILNQAAIESWVRSTIERYDRLIARLAR
jgi:hypothetical protein